jgi:signal-transduction protein with cAMP-binding, CBS, and nucleotidyltransferase domain
MKWSLKRIPLFKNCSNLVLEKIIGKCEIKKFKNSEIIAEKGETVNSLILCL